MSIDVLARILTIGEKKLLSERHFSFENLAEGNVSPVPFGVWSEIHITVTYDHETHFALEKS